MVRTFQPSIGSWWTSDEPDLKLSGYLGETSGTSRSWELVVKGEFRTPVTAGLTRPTLIHGETTEGAYSLDNAYYTGGSRNNYGSAQTWQGARLIRGGHILPDQKFFMASFQIPFLLEWIGPSPSNSYSIDIFSVADDGPETGCEALLSNNAKLSLVVEESDERKGRTLATTERFATYVVRSEEGMSLEQVDKMTLSLARLLSIIIDEPLHSGGLQLHQTTDYSGSPLMVVEGNTATAASAAFKHQLRGPFFDTGEIDFQDFVTRWIAIDHETSLSVSAAAPRDDHSFVTSKFIDVCNGLEALAISVLQAPDPTPADTVVLAALVNAEIRTKDKKFVERSLAMRRFKLEDKMCVMGRLMGSESCDWLLGPNLKHWAHAVVRLRNSIAHGFSLPNGMKEDERFLVASYESTKTVLRLALLVNSGYSNQKRNENGELLWRNGLDVVSHRNSEWFRRIKCIAKERDMWSSWYLRLQDS